MSPATPNDSASIARAMEPVRAVLITCEHASPLLPPGVDLGVSADVRTSHVGWDPGAAEIAAVVAGALGSGYVAGAYSRLWVDLNRPADSAAAVPAVAFGVAIPGNQGLANELRAARLAQFHAPHWQGIIAAIEERVDRFGGCLHVAVHSFDPAFDPAFGPAADPETRRFDAGVLFDPDRQPEAEIAAWLGDALGRAGHDTRANQPYLGTDEGMTTWLRERFPAPVYTGIEIEVSQALAADPARARKLALSLAVALRQCARRWPG